MSDRPLHDQLFDQLAGEAAACAVCERMRERKAVLSRLNGALSPSVMFIAEAPVPKPAMYLPARSCRSVASIRPELPSCVVV